MAQQLADPYKLALAQKLAPDLFLEDLLQMLRSPE
jgi:hypothetical protein